MGILDAPGLGPNSTLKATGAAAGKAMHAWASEVTRHRPPQLLSSLAALMPVMASPPTVTLTKATGVSAAAIVNGGAGYAVGDQITEAGGTFFSAAIIQVVTVSSGVITGVSIRRAGAYTTAPTNPAAQGSTTGSGTGATFNLTMNAGVASTVAAGLTVSRSSGNFRYTGYTPGDAVSGYYGNTYANGTAMLVEWWSDDPHFDIRLVGNNSAYTLYVGDGSSQMQRVSASSITTDASGAPYLLTVDFAGVYRPRKFKLFGINTAFGGLNTSGDASVWLPTEARQPLVLWFGDSYTYGTGSTMQATAACNQTCAALGFECIPNGIGGTGWNSSSPNEPATRMTNILQKLSYPPTRIFLDLGLNDAGGNMTTAAASFDATVAVIDQYAPRAEVFVMGAATPLGATANLDLVDAMLTARAAAYGYPFISRRNVVNTANKGRYTGGDNLHLTDAGHEMRAAYDARKISELFA